jgi:aspartyl-tRNA(Asn)/glutamyl-tRNA(Gln) amidotransferase subunit B
MSQAAAATAEVVYEPVIGIEIHVELKTASKMFCACSRDIHGAAPNARTCQICLALPGTLPVINRRAVELVLATGLAIEAEIAPVTRWDRKNYFYPDLPKGYQISQYDLPLAAGGSLVFMTSSGEVRVRIRRAHLEEDTARLQHAVDDDGRRISLVDFNRAGVPLLEIVTEPDLRSAEAARRYAEELRLLLQAVGASDAAMERGEMRVEANVSLRPAGSEELGTRVEVKNMNSFRAVERAIDYEVERQTAALRSGEAVVQETRGWDDGRGITYRMRLKEDSEDYRYFPEPDLPPLRTDPVWLDEIRDQLPELPAARRARYMSALGLAAPEASVLVAEPAATALFDALLARGADARAAVNWAVGEYLRARNAADDPTAPGLDPAYLASELAELIALQAAGELTAASAKEVFSELVASAGMTRQIVERRGLRRIDDRSTLARMVDDVLAANPAAVADYQEGKQQAFGFLVGQLMRASRGQADPAAARAALEAALSDRSGDASGAE